jgi:hypothetical protein
VDLRDAVLDGAKLNGADLTFSNLRHAHAHETDLRAAKITMEQLRGLCFNTATVFTPGARPEFAPEGCFSGLAGRKRPGTCDAASKSPAACDLRAVRRIIAPVSGYTIACLQVCDPYYVDRGRTHTLARIPRELEGATWIKTTNTGDKNEASESFLRFEIEPPATVYVAYDSRMARDSNTPPKWLTDHFDLTDLVIGLDEPDKRQDFVVYAKTFSQPTVVLGGNRASGARFEKKEGSNYVVLVKPAHRTATTRARSR